MAMVLAARGELEESAAAAIQMLERAHGMESRRIRERMIAVSTAISAQGDSIVARDLAERVHAQLTPPL